MQQEIKNEEDWQKYRNDEIRAISPILNSLGFSLDENQPHTKGEKFLMNAITTKSGLKLILLGRRLNDSKKVVIKVSNNKFGIEEIEHDRKCRDILQKINFAYQFFFSPKEILFSKKNGYTIFIQEFIEQPCSFLERPLEEQFRLALKAFKAQESAHATTYEHFNLIKNNFGQINANGYLINIEKFIENILNTNENNMSLKTVLKSAENEIKNNLENIEQYTGFLTHTDFVPHNIRVAGGKIYLLDHSSIRFGNKYEGWARFLNFMLLYNRPLEEILVKYIADNRTEEESLSLRLMRIYRLTEIIYYYSNTLKNSSENLLELNKKRVTFWANALESLLQNKPVDQEIIDAYKVDRDNLRSVEEKERQIGLH